MNEIHRLKQLAGILVEQDDVFIIYVNGKPAMQYNSESHAMSDYKIIKNKFPSDRVDLGKEECEVKLIKEVHDLAVSALSEEDEAEMEMQAQSNVNAAAAATLQDPVQEEVSEPKIHTFRSTGEAYDATQTGMMSPSDPDENGNYSEVEVNTGDILVIPSEGVIGISATWPVAITKNSGELHTMKDGFNTPEKIATSAKTSIENVMAAIEKAKDMGFETIVDDSSFSDESGEDNKKEITNKDVDDAYQRRHEAFAANSPDKYSLDSYAKNLLHRYEKQERMKNKKKLGDETMEEGFTVMPSIDTERYTDLSAEGLEGPFRLKSGKVVYYDPREGKYYDRDTDMYLSQEEVDQHSLEEAYDLNNGYYDRHYANKDDYFPDGADSPVVDAVGPSGARQGDNPEQKKMQVNELHREMVYNYRKFLKEGEQVKKK